MGHLETGRKDFRLTTIIRVADALEVTLSDLFSGLESGKSPQAERSASRKRKGLTDERPVDRGRVLKEIQSLERTVSSLKSILSNQQAGVGDGDIALFAQIIGKRWKQDQTWLKVWWLTENSIDQPTSHLMPARLST